MVPTALAVGPHLRAVLPSCVAALAGEDNALRLPRLRSAIVLVVDGLGAASLKARAGHARTLAGALNKTTTITTGVPTTTAAALSTLMTAALPGDHGVVAYAALDPVADRVVNQLSGWGGTVDPLVWQRRRTVFEDAAGRVRSVAVGPKKYRTSGLTAAILRGAEYVAADSIAERFDAAVTAAAEEGTLVYLYVPEADQAAHGSGWQSDRWTEALEEIDGAVAGAVRRLPRGTGLLVTADHGILDVPDGRHILFDERADLVDGVRHVGGEPRMVHLYFEPDLAEAERAALVERWRDAESARAWVRTRQEATDEGWFGPVAPEVAPRIGDLLIAARGLVAYYDTRIAGAGARSMVGQHGSWTPEETRVPLLRYGAAAG
ncbi:MAG: alkaline phosphatase family protein [Naasia sp.]|nr:alkaline phosphatase family protein [Naasia sp.]